MKPPIVYEVIDTLRNASKGESPLLHNLAQALASVESTTELARALTNAVIGLDELRQELSKEIMERALKGHVVTIPDGVYRFEDSRLKEKIEVDSNDFVNDTTLKSFALNLGRKITREKDAILSRAISQRLGTETWSEEDLVGRLGMISYPAGIQTYFFDGEKMAEVNQVNVMNEDQKYIATMEIKLF